jgi:hypothetical protein
MHNQVNRVPPSLAIKGPVPVRDCFRSRRPRVIFRPWHAQPRCRLYLSKLLRNGRVVGYLAKHFEELLFEFQKITEAEPTAA